LRRCAKFGQLLKQEQTHRYIADMVTSVEIRCNVGWNDGALHPLVSRWAPNLALIIREGAWIAKTHLAELMHRARGAFRPRGENWLSETANGWTVRVMPSTPACYERPPKLDALQIRLEWCGWPDPTRVISKGKELRLALAKWFGVASGATKSKGER
jgi:hypothetical protein